MAPKIDKQAEAEAERLRMIQEKADDEQAKR